MRILSRWPLYPLLLGAYAVLFVYAANIGEVILDQLMEPLLLSVALAAGTYAVLSLLYRDVRRGALVATAVVLMVMFFGHVAMQLEWLELSGEMLLVGWLLFILAVALYAWRARGSLANVTAVLNVFVFALVALTLLTIVPAETGRAVRASEGEPVAEATLLQATRRPERDIYFLNFDRYGSDWSLKQAYGIDNDLYPALEAMGFQVVPGARANYHTSDLSLASTLNMRYLDDLTERYGRDTGDRTPARELLSRHLVGEFLRQQGYRYDHIGAWWEGTRTSPIADQVLSLGKTAEFAAVLKEGTVLPTYDRLTGNVEQDSASRAQHRDMALFAIRQVQLLGRTPGRKFVFAHILLPHPPYVLGEGGRRILEAEAQQRPEAELYAEQLDDTNDLIKQTVTSLLAGPDESDPIIVLSADEGPYVCGDEDCVDGSPEEFGIRHGVLRAYYLPGLDYQVPADDSGVNIFRTLFREYFGVDLPELPNRAYTWPDKDHLYDFQDITDLLPLPGGPGYRPPSADYTIHTGEATPAPTAASPGDGRASPTAPPG